MINSLVAVGFKLLFMDGFQREAVLDWVASLPFVSLGAPLGTVCLSFVNRTWVSGVIYLVDLSQFVFAISTLPINTDIIFFVVVIVVTTTGLFLLLAKLGEKLIDVENKGYIFDSEDEDDNEDVYGEDSHMSSYESLPSMEELRAGKRKMERREDGSDDDDYDDQEFATSPLGWGPYGRKPSHHRTGSDDPPHDATLSSSNASDVSGTPRSSEITHLLGPAVTAHQPPPYTTPTL
jgi:hypothetical protein